jgi:hypothetical protein
VELYLHSSNTASWRSGQLNHRDNFTFTLPLYWNIRTRSDSVSVVTMLRDGQVEFDSRQWQCGNFGSSPPRPDRVCFPQTLLFSGCLGFFPGGEVASAWSCLLTCV